MFICVSFKAVAHPVIDGLSLQPWMSATIHSLIGQTESSLLSSRLSFYGDSIPRWSKHPSSNPTPSFWTKHLWSLECTSLSGTDIFFLNIFSSKPWTICTNTNKNYKNKTEPFSPAVSVIGLKCGNNLYSSWDRWLPIRRALLTFSNTYNKAHCFPGPIFINILIHKSH